MNKVFFIVISAILSSVIVSISCVAKPLTIVTNQWLPYVNPADQNLGTAAELLHQVYSQEDTKINWQHLNYDLAFELVVKGKQQAAFPYFKTEERAKQVLFSQPIFSATNHIYYNRQKQQQLDLSNLAKFKFGRVAGYSYGQQIDDYLTNAESFASDQSALESLLNNEIDFLPMTQSVMNTLLNGQYKDQALLVKKIDAIAANESLHLIAPKTDVGKQLISQLNSLINQAKAITSLQLKPVERTKRKDIAKLVASEGYPAIVGQTSLVDPTQFYTLPQGTSVLVLNWSEKIRQPSNTDRIYKSMIDLSQVVVLNGPHVGKELFVKNMHLEIQ